MGEKNICGKQEIKQSHNLFLFFVTLREQLQIQGKRAAQVNLSPHKSILNQNQGWAHLTSDQSKESNQKS